MADILAIATKLYDLGLCPMPVAEDGSKRPMGQWRDFQNDRYDRANLGGLFRNSSHGLGLICGKASGNLELLEFEGRSLDDGSYDAFCQAAFNDDRIALTLMSVMEGYLVRSPSGGIHIAYRVDGEAKPNTKLARRPATDEELAENPAEKIKVQIETRGQGGFMVCPPSQGPVHPSGEAWVFESGNFSRIVTITPEQRDILHEIAKSLDSLPAPDQAENNAAGTRSEAGRFPIVPAMSSLVESEHPFDWARHNIDPVRLMEEGGWTLSSQHGDEQQWTRPGKATRDGHSATLHLPEGPLNIYSTSVDLEYARAGKRTGAEITLSVGELYAAVHHQGDIPGAMRYIRQHLMPSPGGTPLERPGEGSGGNDEGVSSELNLPLSFWESRPWLSHILQAADARLVSPDALLMAVVARYAALLPATLQLPGIIGSNATFDWIGCVVSTSSGGKTISNRVAADLLPNIRKDVLMDASPGSGEGLIQAFMGYERDDKGKPTGDPSYRFGQYKAVHITVDEGTGLMEQQARKGTTIVQTLCSAWSGAGMGQLNASTETRRFVPPRKRRVSATVNIQTAFGHVLLGDAMRHIGFPQRLVFAWAHAEPPAEVPDWPGQLDLPSWPDMGPRTMEVAQSVVDAVIEHRRTQMAGKVVLDELEGHSVLARLKLSGIYALMDGRDTLTESDWDLAGACMGTHRAVRSKLLAVKADADRQAIVTQGTKQGLRKLAELDVTERQLIAEMSDKIARLCQDEPWGAGKLARAVSSTETRHRFEDALARAVDGGRVIVTEVNGGRRIEKA